MKKSELAAVLAMALFAATSTPAHAADDGGHKDWVELISVGSFTAQPVRLLVGLLLPAVQAAR